MHCSTAKDTGIILALARQGVQLAGAMLLLHDKEKSALLHLQKLTHQMSDESL
jgi:hypothetical protein